MTTLSALLLFPYLLSTVSLFNFFAQSLHIYDLNHTRMNLFFVV